jgi:hypothetical protein
MDFKVDLTTKEGYSLPVDGLTKDVVLRKRVDFTVAANQLAQNEVMALFKIPAFVLVEEVFMVVRTADADVTDVDIGSFTEAGVGVAADGFMDGLSLAALGLIRDLAGETYSPQDQTAGYMGTSDWVVGFTNKDAQALDGAVVDFFAVCKDLRCGA